MNILSVDVGTTAMKIGVFQEDGNDWVLVLDDASAGFPAPGSDDSDRSENNNTVK